MKQCPRGFILAIGGGCIPGLTRTKVNLRRSNLRLPPYNAAACNALLHTKFCKARKICPMRTRCCHSCAPTEKSRAAKSGHLALPQQLKIQPSCLQGPGFTPGYQRQMLDDAQKRPLSVRYDLGTKSFLHCPDDFIRCTFTTSSPLPRLCSPLLLSLFCFNIFCGL